MYTAFLITVFVSTYNISTHIRRYCFLLKHLFEYGYPYDKSSLTCHVLCTFNLWPYDLKVHQTSCRPNKQRVKQWTSVLRECTTLYQCMTSIQLNKKYVIISPNVHVIIIHIHCIYKYLFCVVFWIFEIHTF